MITKSKIPIHLRMDYWRNKPKRSLNIVGEKGEINWDYYSKTATLHNNGKILCKQKLSKKWNRNQMFMDIMRGLEGEHKHPVEESQLIDELAKTDKFTEDEARSYIRKMQKDSVIYEAKPGYYNIV